MLQQSIKKPPIHSATGPEHGRFFGIAAVSRRQLITEREGGMKIETSFSWLTL